ncbi:MAG: hypothetical protein B7Y02_12855, partial [Rhodobacterales bacterium 17-64-5]
MTPNALTPADFAAAMEATWPALTLHRAGPWTVREGAGGGKRVSAASAEAAWAPDDIALAEQAQMALGQERLFVIWPWDAGLDAALEARGYRRIDPVVGYAAPVTSFAAPARMTTFPHWPPMQIARDLWTEAQVGPGRLAVMARAVAGGFEVTLASGERRTSTKLVLAFGISDKLPDLPGLSER